MPKNNNSKSDQPSKSGEHWLTPFLFMFAKLSGWIAFPVLAAVFLGKWLDNKYGTEPWLFLLCVGTAFLISMAGLAVNTFKIYKDISSNK